MLLNLSQISLFSLCFGLTQSRLYSHYPLTQQFATRSSVISMLTNPTILVLTWSGLFVAFDIVAGHRLITLSFLKHSLLGFPCTTLSGFPSCLAGCSIQSPFLISPQLPELKTSMWPRAWSLDQFFPYIDSVTDFTQPYSFKNYFFVKNSPSSPAQTDPLNSRLIYSILTYGFRLGV